MKPNSNPDQAIHDAIGAAISLNQHGTIIISVSKFIETFNNHRDRKLCTSLHVLDRDEVARRIYEVEPHTESGEWIDGFQVSPGGNLSWQQATDRDAEFGDDPRMGKITEFAYRCADALGAK